MSKIPQEVAVHPVVLLSVVDHYFRLAKETTRRVVGVLLGEYIGGKVDVTSCYALPFEEDPKDKKVWFVDHIYNEQMFEMYQKINYKEVVVGWYSSGPKIRPHDIEINEVFRKYCPNPVFVIIDVQEKTVCEILTLLGSFRYSLRVLFNARRSRRRWSAHQDLHSITHLD